MALRAATTRWCPPTSLGTTRIRTATPPLNCALTVQLTSQCKETLESVLSFFQGRSQGLLLVMLDSPKSEPGWATGANREVTVQTGA